MKGYIQIVKKNINKFQKHKFVCQNKESFSEKNCPQKHIPGAKEWWFDQKFNISASKHWFSLTLCKLGYIEKALVDFQSKSQYLPKL